MLSVLKTDQKATRNNSFKCPYGKFGQGRLHQRNLPRPLRDKTTEVGEL
ncbi:hypothetical protein D918_02589 [Trichuris suis]|nr:hypothetical protein D918_02589 [Trichuris suis]